MSIEDLIDVRIDLLEGDLTFERCIASAISASLPAIEQRLPMTDEGRLALRDKVLRGLELFMRANVGDRIDPILACSSCGRQLHRWMPSPEAGPHFRCSVCGRATL